MADFAAGIAALIEFVCKLVFTMVYTFVHTFLRLCGIGDALPTPKVPRPGRPDGEPTPADWRVQALATALTLLVIGGTIGGFMIYGGIQERRLAAATRLVESHASRLDLGQDPAPPRQPGFIPQAPDPWGQPIRVTYRDHVTHYTVEVRSAGRDRAYDTWDDRVATRRTLRTAGRVLAPAADAAAKIVMDGAIKLWQRRQDEKAESIREAQQAQQGPTAKP